MVYSEVEKGSWQWVQSKCEACEDKVRTVLDEIRCDIPLAIDLAVEMRNGNATSDKDIKISDINADKITDNLRDIKLTDNGYVINVTITADVQAPSSSSPNVEEEVLIGQEDDITVICGDNNTDDDNEVLEGWLDFFWIFIAEIELKKIFKKFFSQFFLKKHKIFQYFWLWNLSENSRKFQKKN